MPGMEDARHSVLMEFLTDNTDMKKAAQSGLKQGLVAGGADLRISNSAPAPSVLSLRC